MVPRFNYLQLIFWNEQLNYLHFLPRPMSYILFFPASELLGPHG